MGNGGKKQNKRTGKKKKRDEGNGKRRGEAGDTEPLGFGYAGGGAGIEGTSIGREEESEQGCAYMLQPVDAGSRD